MRGLLFIALLLSFARAYAQTEASNVNFTNENPTPSSDKFNVELGYSSLMIKPQIFSNRDSDSKLGMNGVNAALGKAFAISDNYYTISSIRMLRAVDNSTILAGQARKSVLVSAQYVQQFGVTIPSWNFKHASLQPLVGFGGYWAQLKDEILQNTINGRNTISETGLVAEVGVALEQPSTGIYSTFRISTMMALSSSAKSSDVNSADLRAANKASIIGSTTPILFNFDIGLKF
jgi:hypothetical protein